MVGRSFGVTTFKRMKRGGKIGVRSCGGGCRFFVSGVVGERARVRVGASARAALISGGLAQARQPRPIDTQRNTHSYIHTPSWTTHSPARACPIDCDEHARADARGQQPGKERELRVPRPPSKRRARASAHRSSEQRGGAPLAPPVVSGRHWFRRRSSSGRDQKRGERGQTTPSATSSSIRPRAIQPLPTQRRTQTHTP